ncbi:hypothetical protein PO909_023721 [Leuciscus waleckii]
MPSSQVVISIAWALFIFARLCAISRRLRLFQKKKKTEEDCFSDAYDCLRIKSWVLYREPTDTKVSSAGIEYCIAKSPDHYVGLRQRDLDKTERSETKTRPRPKTVKAVTRPKPRKSGLETKTGLETYITRIIKAGGPTGIDCALGRPNGRGVERKKAKYEELAGECHRRRWNTRCLRSLFTGQSLCRALKVLGISGLHKKKGIRNIMDAA